MDETPTARWIRERDIDLIVAEELRASDAFRTMVLKSLVPPWSEMSVGDIASSIAQVSVDSAGEGAGESDLHWDIRFRTGTRLAVLIENKIDAPLQPQQIERYQTRARKEGNGVVLLLAPTKYDPAGADGHLTYESIHEHLSSRAATESGELAQRLAFRAELIGIAIRRFETGYIHRPDTTVTEFWRRYNALATARSPRLALSVGRRSARSGHIAFRRALPHTFGLGPIPIIHKLSDGNVDLQVARRAGAVDRVQAQMKIPRDVFSIQRAGQSLVIRIEVTPVASMTSFDDSQPQIIEGIEAAHRLMQWWDQGGGEALAAALGTDE
ncbi:MAG: hypothetical protein CVU47_05670 [Chloroflexi bacterium HGW-Chloroflexi-9]|nr:MAG: hypothetical protein CVU47_05670 [Chloroflexi bacterium HGW-Chloroflexi-9]